MRLLLDEMLPPQVASALRARGLDVVAIKEHQELIALGDEEVLDVAILDDRAVVTDNLSDFLPIFWSRTTSGLACASIVALSSTRLNRNSKAFKGELIRTLERFVAATPVPSHPSVWFT